MRDYTKYSKKNRETKPEEIVVPVEPEEIQNGEETPEVVQKIGIVTDCLKLNVRMEPDAHSEVVCVVDASTDLMIDEDASTGIFYKVYTAAGLEGYCMKKFVTIKP